MRGWIVRPAARKGLTMDRFAIVGDTETDCRAFAAQHPTPQVLRGIALAEAGTVSWLALYGVFHKALATGLAAVTA